MKCLFNGVGEAVDPDLGNCSIWLEAAPGGTKRTLLLDCGFTAPFALLRHLSAHEVLDLDMLWISHFHGDHFMGLPALLLYFHEQRRTKTLTIAGPEGVEETTRRTLELAYPSLWPRLPFRIQFQAAVPGATLLPLGLSLQAAYTDHSLPNLCLRIDDGTHSLFYSGDGRPTQQSLALAKGADLVIHESFSLEEDTAGHGTIPGSIEFARFAQASRVALVHVRREVRAQRKREVLRHIQNCNDIQVLLPEPGAVVLLEA